MRCLLFLSLYENWSKGNVNGSSKLIYIKGTPRVCTAAATELSLLHCKYSETSALVPQFHPLTNNWFFLKYLCNYIFMQRELYTGSQLSYANSAETCYRVIPQSRQCQLVLLPLLLPLIQHCHLEVKSEMARHWRETVLKLVNQILIVMCLSENPCFWYIYLHETCTSCWLIYFFLLIFLF